MLLPTQYLLQVSSNRQTALFLPGCLYLSAYPAVVGPAEGRAHAQRKRRDEKTRRKGRVADRFSLNYTGTAMARHSVYRRDDALQSVFISFRELTKGGKGSKMKAVAVKTCLKPPGGSQM